MKVLNQLIQHFWDRGALSLDQAHYLVEHGFVKAADLDNYVPRPPEPEEADAAMAAEPVEVLLPDEWDQREEVLVEKPAGKKRGKAAPKLPEYDLARLRDGVVAALAEREDYFPALVELAERLRVEMGAKVLSQQLMPWPAVLSEEEEEEDSAQHRADSMEPQVPTGW